MCISCFTTEYLDSINAKPLDARHLRPDGRETYPLSGRGSTGQGLRKTVRRLVGLRSSAQGGSYISEQVWSKFNYGDECRFPRLTMARTAIMAPVVVPVDHS